MITENGTFTNNSNDITDQKIEFIFFNKMAYTTTKQNLLGAGFVATLGAGVFLLAGFGVFIIVELCIINS